MSTIAAGVTSGTALVNTGDTTGNLVFQTNGTTTALTLNTSQNATFAGDVSVTGSLSTTGGIPSPLVVKGNSTAGSELRLPEDTDNGSNYVALKAADNIASNVTFTLPAADGTSGQVIQTNGSGTLSFVTPGGGSWIYITSATASSSASLAFTNISSTYDMYVFELIQVKPASDGRDLRIRTSTNNGSSYDSGAQDYRTSGAYWTYGNNSTSIINGETSYIYGNGDSLGNAADETGSSGLIYLINPSAAQYCMMIMNLCGINGSTNHFSYFATGIRTTQADVDAVQFSMNTGNIASGTIRLYGIKNS